MNEEKQGKQVNWFKLFSRNAYTLWYKKSQLYGLIHGRPLASLIFALPTTNKILFLFFAEHSFMDSPGDNPIKDISSWKKTKLVLNN